MKGISRAAKSLERGKYLTPIELRLSAERRLATRDSRSELDFAELRLLHELDVHDEELAIQNEELLRGRQELEEALARHRETLDAAPIGYLRIDEHGRIESTNEIACAMLGRPAAAFFGAELTSFVLEEDAQILHRHLQYVRTNRARHSCEVRIALRAGEPRLYRVDGNMSATEDWQYAALLDVERGSQGQEASWNRENIVRTIMDASSDAILIVDESDTIIAANAATESVFGLTPAEALGLPLTALIPAWSAHDFPSEGARHITLARRKDQTSFVVALGSAALRAGSNRSVVAARESSEGERAQAGGPETMVETRGAVRACARELEDAFAAISSLVDEGLRTATDEMRASLLEIGNGIAAGKSVVQRLLALPAHAAGGAEDIARASVRQIETIPAPDFPPELRRSQIVARDSAAPAILVVDDHDPTRTALQRLLADTRRYRVHAASSVAEALGIAGRERIDILLAEIVVGRGRGDLLALMLRERNPDLPVLFVTTSSNIEPGGGIVADGNTKFLRKPAGFDVIERALSELLEGIPRKDRAPP